MTGAGVAEPVDKNSTTAMEKGQTKAMNETEICERKARIVVAPYNFDSRMASGDNLYKREGMSVTQIASEKAHVE